MAWAIFLRNLFVANSLNGRRGDRVHKMVNTIFEAGSIFGVDAGRHISKILNSFGRHGDPYKNE